MMQDVSTGFGFRVVGRSGFARVGELSTPHGIVNTPTFMPVGTQGSVKTLTPSEVARGGAQIVLGNTYHLWLRPGAELIARAGGLHRFSQWPHVMLTDSGGYQAFSLAALRKASEDGFTFRSHLDGSAHHLSPEEAMRVQGLIGADIAMQLDVCPQADASHSDVAQACAMTTRWAKRCLRARDPKQALFGIVQGGCYLDLRIAHAQELEELPLEGFALGGFSVGEPIERMHATLEQVAHRLPETKPRYLMGVGTPLDLLLAVRAGVDMFDCVLPTRNARNGQALTKRGRVVIKQARYREDALPIDPDCGCDTCQGGFSRSYLRHLFLAREILALRLISQHNLWLYGALMKEARDAILKNRYDAFFAEWQNSGSHHSDAS